MADTTVVYKVVANIGKARKDFQALKRTVDDLNDSNKNVLSSDKEAVSTNRDLSSSTRDLTKEREKQVSVTDKSARLTDRLVAGVKDLGARIHGTRGELDQYNRSVDEHGRSLDGVSTKTDAYASRLATAAQRFSVFISAHRTAGSSMRSAEQDSDHLADSVEDVGDAMHKSGGDGNFFTRELGKLSSGFTKARTAGKDFGYIMKLFKIPVIVAGINLLIGAIDALAGSIVGLLPNLVQLTGLAGALPGVFLGIAGAALTAFAGLKGIGDAVGALGDVQKETTQATADGAQTEYDAAQRAQAIADATKNLTDARESALRALQDLRLEEERANLSAKQAKINLIEARRSLAQLYRPGADATDLDIAGAKLDVQSAELDLRDAKLQSQRTTEDLAEAERKGVEQSDEVVAARRALESATHNATVATQEMSSAQTKLQDAFASLTPVAQRFARFLFGLKPVMDKLRATAQKGLLPGLQKAIQNLLKLVPLAQMVLRNFSDVLADAAVEGSELVTSGPFRRDFAKIMKNSAGALRIALGAFWKFIDALRNVAVVARPMVTWIADTIDGWADWAVKASEAGRRTGNMADFFKQAMDAAEQMGRILSDLWHVILNVTDAADKQGQALWDSIEGATERWREWTGEVENQNAIADWVDRSTGTLHEFILLLKDLFLAFVGPAEEGASQLSNLFQLMREKLVPALATLSESVADTFAPALVETITQVVLAFAALGGQGGTLTAFLGVLNKVLEIFNYLIETIPHANDVLSIFFQISGTFAGLIFLKKYIWAGVITPFLSVVPAVLGAIKVIGQFIALAAARGLPLALETMGGGFAKLGTIINGFKTGGLAGGVEALTSAIHPATIAMAGLAAIAITAFINFKDSAKAVDELTANLRAGTEAQRAFVASAAAGNENTFGDKLRSGVDRAVAGLSFGAIPEGGKNLNLFGKTTEEEAQSAFANANKVSAALSTVSKKFDDGQRSATAYLGTIQNLEHEYGEGSVGSEEFANILKTQIVPAYMDGRVSQEAWNDAVAVGNELGVDATAILEKQEAALRKQTASRIIGNTFDHNRESVEKFAEATGTTFDQLVRDGAEAYSQSKKDGDAWVREQIQSVKDLRAGYAETFDFVGQSLDKFAGKQNVTSDQIISTFKDQNEALADYNDDWDTVSKRAGDSADSLLSDIAAMGQDGAALLDELANANDEDFKQILGQWKEGQKGSKNLADDITTQLVGSIDHLTRVLKNIPNRIAIALGLDTKDADDDLAAFIAEMKKNGFSVKTTPGGEPEPRPGRNTNPDESTHSGGWAGHGKNRPRGQKKPGEVDARLERGEYVVRKRFAKDNIDALQRINRGEQLLPEYHIGGSVSGSMDKQSSGIAGIANSFKRSKIEGVLKTPEFVSPFLVSGEAKGGYTPVMYALNKWIMSRHGDLTGGPVPGHSSTVTSSGNVQVSQHAYGNARDYFGGAAGMMSMFNDVVKNAIAGPLKAAVYHVIHAGREYVHGLGGTRPYTGTTDMHYGHVHAGAWPPYAGTPPIGHPAPYRRGGLTGQDGGTTHKGEFVVNRNASKAVGTNFLNAVNMMKAGESPARVSSSFFDALGSNLAVHSGVLASVPRVSMGSMGSTSTGGTGKGTGGGAPEQVNLRVDIDGETLVRTMETHSRDIAIKVGGRGRAGLNSGSRN